MNLEERVEESDHKPGKWEKLVRGKILNDGFQNLPKPAQHALMGGYAWAFGQHRSPKMQEQIEDEAGFPNGYISQVGSSLSVPPALATYGLAAVGMGPIPDLAQTVGEGLSHLVQFSDTLQHLTGGTDDITRGFCGLKTTITVAHTPYRVWRGTEGQATNSISEMRIAGLLYDNLIDKSEKAFKDLKNDAIVAAKYNKERIPEKLSLIKEETKTYLDLADQAVQASRRKH